MNKIFYTFVLSALVLLSVQCNPKPQESDEQIGNDSIIDIRNEIASRLDIDSFQELLASHWKPYLDNLHV